MILVVIPAILVAAVSLAAFGGRWVWWLDVLSNFRVQYLILLVPLGVVIVLSRFRKIGYVVLAVAAVNLALIAPLYFGSPREADAAAPALRVLSFNLLSTNEEYGAVVDYIREANPDLVFLHEASRPWETAMENSGLDYQVIRPRSDNLTFGTLVLARDPVEAISFGFAEGQPRAVQLVYSPEGWPVTVDVLATHPLSPVNEVDAGLRDAQIEFAADWAAERRGAYLVVGDLNATPWSASFGLLLDRGSLRNSQIGFGVQPSFSANTNVLFRVPIDHLLHSESLTVRERKLGPRLGSDHFPLLVDLQYLP